jgi:hypothetical protein
MFDEKMKSGSLTSQVFNYEFPRKNSPDFFVPGNKSGSKGESHRDFYLNFNKNFNKSNKNSLEADTDFLLNGSGENKTKLTHQGTAKSLSFFNAKTIPDVTESLEIPNDFQTLTKILYETNTISNSEESTKEEIEKALSFQGEILKKMISMTEKKLNSH